MECLALIAWIAYHHHFCICTVHYFISCIMFLFVLFVCDIPCFHFKSFFSPRNALPEKIHWHFPLVPTVNWILQGSYPGQQSTIGSRRDQACHKVGCEPEQVRITTFLLATRATSKEKSHVLIARPIQSPDNMIFISHRYSQNYISK